MNKRVVYISSEMVSHHLLVSAQEDAWIKGLVESYEGVANVFAERAGELIIAAPLDRSQELNDLLNTIDEFCTYLRQRTM